MVSIEQVKKLREETGISVAECKKALEKANGNSEEAKKILKELGKEFSQKRIGKATGQGIIESYIHPNKKIGAFLDLRCETDFVARSEGFQGLAHEICLQVAAVASQEIDLLEQEWIKDGSRKVKDLVNDQIAKSGENIVVERFIRYEI